jgi:mono/diheme cytochrome c family protein
VKQISPTALVASFAFLFIALAISPAAIPQKPAAQAVANGQRIFNQSCATCHDAHGATAKSGPALKSYYRQHNPHPTDAAVRAIILDGKGKMPSFSTLNKSQTDDLVAYLKTL